MIPQPYPLAVIFDSGTYGATPTEGLVVGWIETTSGRKAIVLAVGQGLVTVDPTRITRYFLTAART